VGVNVLERLLYFNVHLIDKWELIKVAGYQTRRFFRFQYPSFVSLFLLKLVNRNPKTFNQKILYKIAHDRSPQLSLFADKIAVREYVANKIGPEYLSKIYAEFRDPKDFTFIDIPRNFVLKPNHVSGAALIVADFFAQSSRKDFVSRKFFLKYYVNPDSMSEDCVRRLVKFWLSKSYFGYHNSGFPEWAYKNISPCVYIEELLSSNNQPPEDFRFFMFDGKCQVVMVDTPGFSGVRRDIYSPDWTLLDVEFGYPNSKVKRERPEGLTQMIEIAEKLSLGIDHVRVDLYYLSGRIVFSELTNYHAGGTQKFKPSDFDLELGANWYPNRVY